MQIDGKDLEITLALGEHSYLLNEYLFGKIFVKRLLTEPNACIQTGDVGGKLKVSMTDIISFLKEKGFKCVVNNQKHGLQYFIFASNNSTIGINFDDKNKAMSADIMSLDEDEFKTLLSLKDFVSKKKTNLVYALVQTSSGMQSQLIGQDKCSLVEDNYHPEVLDDFKFVINEFEKSDPNGRIVILDGDPGTGKTHLIRALFDKLDVIFLIVHASLISQLDGPQLLPTLLSLKNEKKPITIIVEDGDQILVPRKSDNISSISSLLNLSDGILGTLIDLRIVISTNSAIKEMDEAILRPGRLCKRINVGALEYEHANRIYKKLTNSENSLPKQKFYSLAEVYELSKNKDSINIKNRLEDKRIIGFTNAPSSNYDQILNKKDYELA